MVNVFLVCPTCKKKGFIEIPEERNKDPSGGILAIDLEANILCQHSFIVYLDNNLKVRECVIPDFKVELPELKLEDQIRTTGLPDRDVFDIDLIKLNLPFILLAHVLKSIFFKEKIVIISNQEFFFSHIYNFFKDITQDSFGIDIYVTNQDGYMKNKKKYKNCVVLEEKKVLEDCNKTINPKKLKVEKQIVKNFLSTYDLVYCYITLKNEINKAYELSKSIADYVIKSKEAEELNQQIITVFLKAKYQIKISNAYLTFLCEIVKIYFEVEDSRILYPNSTFKSFWNS